MVGALASSEVIRLDRVSKAYRVIRQPPFLARDLFRLIVGKRRPAEIHWALRDVSFSIEKVEAVGVIGANGSGKSTLLGLIARTTYPTEGSVEVKGRLGPMLELGAGFHPDLTGAENVYLNASLLGLDRKAIDERFDAIVDFAGIGDFLDAPLSTYSTGMSARLGFAVIAHIDPEVLLLDEVLAVGDHEFQARCARTMAGFREAGKTMFLVSHDMSAVRHLCTRVIWIANGRVAADGPCGEVIERYLESFQQPAAQG